MADTVAEMTADELRATMQRCDATADRAKALMDQYVAQGATHGRLAAEYNGAVEMLRTANRTWNAANAEAWQRGLYA